MKIPLLLFSVLAIFICLSPVSQAISSPSTGKIPSRLVKVNSLYAMMIPNHMSEDTSLNDEASLQYSDTNDELYVIVIDEITKDFADSWRDDPDYDKSKSVIENYALIQQESIIGNMSEVNAMSDMHFNRINGLQSYTFTCSGFVAGIDPEILYKVSFFQGKEHVYMVMTWTLTASRSENLPEMDSMLASFREI